VDRFHGFVDRRRSESPTDRSNGAVAGSLELALGATPVSGSSPQVGEKGEELRGEGRGVFTEGTKGRHGGRIGRATVNGGDGGRGPVGMCFGAGRGEKSSGRSCG
jgi:hypothetical protein